MGKSYLLNHTLERLPRCKPLLTAPTNEAVRQIEKFTGDKYELKTIYSALGFRFDTGSQREELKHTAIPQDLERFNLLVVDESSMVGQTLFDVVENTHCRVLFVGHSSQLPEVKKNLSVFDKCESLVFTKGFQTYTLTTPVRNTGELYDFCQHLEGLIGAKDRTVKRDYDMSKPELHQLLLEDKGGQFADESLKMVCWTNATVDVRNVEIRKTIFQGDNLPTFLPSDKVLLTKPTMYLGDLARLTQAAMKKLKKKGFKLTTNTAMEVKAVSKCKVLGVSCSRLSTVIQDISMEVFVPEELEELEVLKHSLLIKAYGMKSPVSKARAFQHMHFILSLFAEVKHSYALTAYRSQGMTIKNVIVGWDDMRRCPNKYLAHKLLYVGGSRAGEGLRVLR